MKNEYVLSDITASGATLVYTSNGADITPQFYYGPSTSGTVTFAVFETDGSGEYSRMESYNQYSVTFVDGTQCVP